MPLKGKKINGKWRIIEADTGEIAKNDSGTALDGGGHETPAQASRQISAISISKARKAGHRIPKR